MSKETLEWLQVMTLIGFTKKRGNAWHYQEALQGTESNHYEGAIPVEDVRRRLFDWEAVKQPVFIKVDDEYVEVPEKNAVVANDDNTVLGIFSDNYEPHQYKQWLIQNVESILDDDLGIGSAGLLRGRGQAWVSVEVPENIKTPEGVEFRPNLVAATSFDGSLATTYARTVTNVVCDNTLMAGLGEDGQKFRLRHTKYSSLRITDARDALKIVYAISDDFQAEVARLCATKVSDAVWNKVLNTINPIPEDEGRSKVFAENKRTKLVQLYTHDDRVAPWKGTAFGVLQAFNTYEHHYAGTRGQSKVQRNRAAALNRSIAIKDEQVLDVLASLVHPLVNA